MMRIAIPVTNGSVAQHFGHCERFAFFDVGRPKPSICAAAEVGAPEHQPGLLPAWLRKHSVTVTGVQHELVNETAELYLGGSLSPGPNGCDH